LSDYCKLVWVFLFIPVCQLARLGTTISHAFVR
jgi:hypothetical protein